MILQSIETFADRFVGFVRVTADDGSQGWGQVSPYNADITAEVLHRQVAPWILGAELPDTVDLSDPSVPEASSGRAGTAGEVTDLAGLADLDDRLDLVTEREHKFPGSYLRRAMGGIDTALWDLWGRRAGKPVVSLLGGSPGPLRAYASSMKRDITPRAEGERLQRLRDDKGFDAFKIRVGAEVGRDRDEWPGRTETVIPALRMALGPDVALLADANSCYSIDRAIAVGRRLEDQGYCHYEEPCPYWKLDDTKRVTEALEIDVTGGEQDCHINTWRRIIDDHVVDVVQPDILYLGGVARTLKVARMAAVAGRPVTPHCANLSMVTLFTMHVLKAIPNAGAYLEFSIEGPDYYPWQNGLFVNCPYTVDNGCVTISDRPGWGVEVHPEWLAKARYKSSIGEGGK